MTNDIQAAAERWNAYRYSRQGDLEEDAKLLADYAAMLVPQLVAALKAAREEIIDRIETDYYLSEADKKREAAENRVLKQLDDAIAAGEGRDAERS